MKVMFGSQRHHCAKKAGNLPIVVAVIVVSCFVVSSTVTNAMHAQIAPADVIPTITTCDVSLRVAAPGDSITFSYTINNTASTAQTVGLGASIRLGSTSTSDTANDIVVSVAPGTSTKTRSFKIPSTANLGNYGVRWEIWSGTPGSSGLWGMVAHGSGLVVEGPINWLLIGGILGGVVLVGVTVGWRLKSKKRESAGTT